MQSKNINMLRMGAMIAMATMLACTGNDSRLGGASSLSAGTLESFSAKPGNFRVSLTDAPAKDLKSVFVNVLNMELWLDKGGKEARVIIGKNLGLIDLMTLRNGVLLPVQDMTIPEGVSVKKIRLILGNGNYAVKKDDSVCPLQTPSGQQSGIKINLTNAVTVENDFTYSLVVDFDAEKSVVIKGNGGCLLKPVLKVAGFTKLPEDQVDPDGENNQPGDDVTGGNQDGNVPDPVDDTGTDDPADDPTSEDDIGTGGEIGYDDSNPEGWPPGYEPIEIPSLYEGQ